MTLKQKLLLVSLTLVAGFSVWGLAWPAQATVVGVLSDIFQTLGNAIYMGIMPYVNNLLGILLSDSAFFLHFNSASILGGLPGLGKTSELISQIWQLCLTIANSIFIIALVYSAISIILGTNTSVYNIKKVLTSLIPAVLFANLSLWIIQALLEIGDLLAKGFMQLLKVDLSQILNFITSLASLGSTTTWGKFVDFMTGLAHLLYSLNLWSYIFPMDSQKLGPALASLVMLMLLFWVFLKILLVLLERTFWLFLLTIAAPLAFAVDLLPISFTQKLSSKWLENVLKWILIFPMIQIALATVIYIFDSSNVTAGVIIDLIKRTPGKEFSNLDPGQVGALLIGFTILYFTGMIPQYIKIGGAALSGMVATPAAAYKAAKQGIYQPIAGTLAGKTAVGKALYGAGRGSYNVAMGTKGGRAVEAWRQTRTGLLGRIINPKGEKSRVEAERGKKMDAAKSQQLSRNVAEAKAKLDAAAQSKHGSNWDDLAPNQREEMKKNKGIRTAAAYYNPAAVKYFADKAVKDIDVHAMPNTDKITKSIEDDVRDKKYGDANISLAQLNKKLHSSGVSQEEKEKIRQWIDATGHDLSKESGYTMPKRSPQAPAQPAPPTDSTSYAELYNAQNQVVQDTADLQRTGHLDATDTNRLKAGTSSGTLDKQSLTDLSTALHGASGGDIGRLTAGTGVQDIVADIANNDVASARMRLDSHGITDATAQDEIIKRAKTMDAADLKIQLGSVVHEKAGGNLDSLISTMERLQSNQKTATEIQHNLVSVVNNARASYNMAITNALAQPGGATVIDHTGASTSANDRAAVDANAANWQTQLQTFMRNNPTTKGDNTLAQIQASATGAGINVASLVTTLKNLGLGGDIQGGNISIDDALKRLHTIRP